MNNDNNTRDTVKINIQLSYAQEACESLRTCSTDVERTQHINTVALALEIMKHKILRIQELESEISKLKTKIVLKSFSDDDAAQFGKTGT